MVWGLNRCASHQGAGTLADRFARLLSMHGRPCGWCVAGARGVGEVLGARNAKKHSGSMQHSCGSRRGRGVEGAGRALATTCILALLVSPRLISMVLCSRYISFYGFAGVERCLYPAGAVGGEQTIRAPDRSSTNPSNSGEARFRKRCRVRCYEV
jgi:hypothetical protein